MWVGPNLAVISVYPNAVTKKCDRTFTVLASSLGIVATSVVDPNTLNLDPDPGFWPNLDPDPGLYNQF